MLICVCEIHSVLHLSKKHPWKQNNDCLKTRTTQEKATISQLCKSVCMNAEYYITAYTNQENLNIFPHILLTHDDKTSSYAVLLISAIWSSRQ